MRTIVVSGEKSGVGKTYVAGELLRYLSGAGCSDSLKGLFDKAIFKLRNCKIRHWSALKITVSKADGCPHDRSCGVCQKIEKPFYVIKDRAIIDQTGKDTARLKEAGAREVIWLKARPNGLKEGLRKAFSALDSRGGVVIEGTSVLKFLKPDLNIHIYSRDSIIWR